MTSRWVVEFRPGHRDATGHQHQKITVEIDGARTVGDAVELCVFSPGGGSGAQPQTVVAIYPLDVIAGVWKEDEDP